MMYMYQDVDHMTFSEHFRTIEFPANKAAKMGDQALCKAIKNAGYKQ